MALNTRHMIVERHPVAGRMAGQRDGVRGYAQRLQPQLPQQPPAHLSSLPSQVRCLRTATSGLSWHIRNWIASNNDPVRCDTDKSGSLQAGRPAVLSGTVGSKAGVPTTFTVGSAAGSPEAPKG
jgi:hypothetical protein